jgi:hypothetical protein
MGNVVKLKMNDKKIFINKKLQINFEFYFLGYNKVAR